MAGPRHVLLLRHGATADSGRGLFTGRADVPLSPHGVEQARAWAPVLATRDDVVALASPLSRAADTARHAGLEPVLAPALVEWDLGSLEGRDADGYRTAHPGWSLFIDGVPEGGESHAAVAARAGEAWAQLTGAGGGLVVAVSHGQFLRALLTTVLGLPLAAGARLSLGPARAGLVSLRAGGHYSLTGWNLAPAPLEHGLLTELT